MTSLFLTSRSPGAKSIWIDAPPTRINCDDATGPLHGGPCLWRCMSISLAQPAGKHPSTIEHKRQKCKSRDFTIGTCIRERSVDNMAPLDGIRYFLGRWHNRESFSVLRWTSPKLRATTGSMYFASRIDSQPAALSTKRKNNYRQPSSLKE